MSCYNAQVVKIKSVSKIHAESNHALLHLLSRIHGKPKISGRESKVEMKLNSAYLNEREDLKICLVDWKLDTLGKADPSLSGFQFK